MKKERFGTLDDGTGIHLYRLEGDGGVSLTVTEYGARIVDLTAPDRRGDAGSVVIGYRSLEEYVADPMYFGASVGRVAGRIGGASFTLAGTSYRLPPNDGPNLLHGGRPGFHEVAWTLDAAASTERKAVFRYRSPGGEAGFPGTLDAVAEFSVESPGEVRITYRGSTDRTTLFNPTNHAYFNLSGGEEATVDGHRLRINAASYTPFDDSFALTGEVRGVDGEPADFREPCLLGDRIPRLRRRHGDNYVIGSPGEMREAAVAVHEPSGRRLTVFSEAGCLQFFGGQPIPGGLTDRSGREIRPRGAFCLESQDYPDGANHPEPGGTVLRPGEEYRRTTIWRFDVV